MTGKEILQASLLDLLFENRNKQYGAYALRKDYNKRLGMALGLGITSVMITLLLLVKDPDPVILDPAPPEAAHRLIDLIVHPEVELPPVAPKPEVPPPARSAAVKLTDRFEIVKQTRAVVPTDVELLSRTIGTTSVDGPAAPGLQPPLAPAGGGGNGLAIPVPGPDKKPEIVQRAAQFPGGMEAWLNFLSRHLRTPQDMEPGEKKTVVIQFQVAEDGSVTGFEVLQTAGKYFDNEVIRVLKKMPKWLPAVKNGTIVPVSFTQPVTFVGVEE